MLIIYIDADACPVKDEIYRVARRYAMRVVVVANAPLRVPADTLFELVVRPASGPPTIGLPNNAAPATLSSLRIFHFPLAPWQRMPASSTREAMPEPIATSALRSACAI